MKITLDQKTLDLFNELTTKDPYYFDNYLHVPFEYQEILEMVSNDILHIWLRMRIAGINPVSQILDLPLEKQKEFFPRTGE